MERGVTPGGFRARCVIAVFVAAVLFFATVIGLRPYRDATDRRIEHPRRFR